MSTGYCIIPLGAFTDDASWLTGLGLELPLGWEQSRTPTYEDFRVALSTWDDCEYGEKIEQGNLNIWATRHNTPDSTIITVDYKTIDGIRSSYGSPEWLIALTERLAQRCGPFLLISDASSAIIVDSGTSMEAKWAELT